MENAKFDLPIRGTLKNPKIDGEALKEHWKAIGTDLLGGSVQAGVNGLQRLLQGLPEDGLRGLFPLRRQTAKPPPPQVGLAGPRQAAHRAKSVQQLREERRQERLQKKAERRRNRGLPPE